MDVDLTPTQIRYLEYLAKHEIKEEPEYITQRQAWLRFGQGNVKRWRDTKVITTHYRNRDVNFKLSELLDAAAKQQTTINY